MHSLVGYCDTEHLEPLAPIKPIADRLVAFWTCELPHSVEQFRAERGKIDGRYVRCPLFHVNNADVCVCVCARARVAPSFMSTMQMCVYVCVCVCV